MRLNTPSHVRLKTFVSLNSRLESNKEEEELFSGAREPRPEVRVSEQRATVGSTGATVGSTSGGTTQLWWVVPPDSAVRVRPVQKCVCPNSRTAMSISSSVCLERDFKLPWREAGPPDHQDDKVDSDQ